MEEQELILLLKRRMKGELGAAQSHELDQVLANPALKTTVIDAFANVIGQQDRNSRLEASFLEPLLDRALSIDRPDPAKAAQVAHINFLKNAWMRYAAALLLIAGTVTFLFINHTPQKDTAQAKVIKKQTFHLVETERY